MSRNGNGIRIPLQLNHPTGACVLHAVPYVGQPLIFCRATSRRNTLFVWRTCLGQTNVRTKLLDTIHLTSNRPGMRLHLPTPNSWAPPWFTTLACRKHITCPNKPQFAQNATLPLLVACCRPHGRGNAPINQRLISVVTPYVNMLRVPATRAKR